MGWWATYALQARCYQVLDATACAQLPNFRMSPPDCRPNYGRMASVLRQAGTSKEVLYHRVQAAYRQLAAHPTALHLLLRPLDLEQTRRQLSLALGGVEVRHAGFFRQRKEGWVGGCQ